jgi:hypothetical protein
MFTDKSRKASQSYYSQRLDQRDKVALLETESFMIRDEEIHYCRCLPIIPRVLIVILI